MSFDNVACPKCGKVFKFRSSLAKYHSWCDGVMIEHDDLSVLLDQAESAGRAAAANVNVVPMYVVERANPLDDTSDIVRAYPPVMDGVCGFAWVHVKGNTKLANVMSKRYGRAFGNDYPTGKSLWIHDYNQSMTRKEAYATAFAQVLRDAGHDHVYANSRMD